VYAGGGGNGIPPPLDSVSLVRLPCLGEEISASLDMAPPFSLSETGVASAQLRDLVVDDDSNTFPA
jgi:hypothetical protein